MLNIAVYDTIKKVAELAEETDKVDRNLIMKVFMRWVRSKYFYLVGNELTGQKKVVYLGIPGPISHPPARRTNLRSLFNHKNP